MDNIFLLSTPILILVILSRQYVSWFAGTECSMLIYIKHMI